MTRAATGDRGFESFSVDAQRAGMRLELLVRELLPALSRRAVREAIEAGKVLLNGRLASKGDRVRQGEVVAIAREITNAQQLSPNADLPVHVLFEDAHVVAVDKPAGIPSHALRPYETATVANYLLAKYPEMRLLSRAGLEAGLIHRLDTDTSGVLIAARTLQARDYLREQFAARQVRKEYCALVVGKVAEPGTVRQPLEDDPRHPGKMRVALHGRGREAVTHYWPVERYTEFTLLRIDIYTGVRHQIRAHLASLGHPIVGDKLYGGESSGLMLTRQFLHAIRLSLPHPARHRLLTIESKLPADLAGILHELRRHERKLWQSSRPRPRHDSR